MCVKRDHVVQVVESVPHLASELRTQQGVRLGWLGPAGGIELS